MSPAKLRTDKAIGRAYRDLADDPRARVALEDLLARARRCSCLLSRPIRDDAPHHPVAALRNLARFSRRFVRPLGDWHGDRRSTYGDVSSLARHLLCRYDVPRFLSLVWFGDGTLNAVQKREWYVAHGNGQSVRSLDLPVRMTRKMERFFLSSPDHLSFESAVRRAELLALGARDDLIAAVLATHLGRDLAQGTFWRTVLALLVRFADELRPQQVGPIIDFIHGVRHRRLEVLGVDGTTAIMEPPQPAFSIRGRTVASLSRLVEEWHGGLEFTSPRGLSWNRSRQRSMLLRERPLDPAGEPVLWEFVELTTGTELQVEGRALRHCVASYASWCWRGASRIRSLRRRRGSSAARAVVTIEVDPVTSTIVQARGRRNRRPSSKAREMIHAWARRENLRIKAGAC